MRFPCNHVLHLKGIITVLSLKGSLQEVVHIFNIRFLFYVVRKKYDMRKISIISIVFNITDTIS